MTRFSVLILIPNRQSPAVVDQSLGARLAALQDAMRDLIAAEELNFEEGDWNDIAKQIVPWRGKISAVVGATGVSESTALGELAERFGLLCFVSNNNPSVWKGKRHIFHIGLPSSQTAGAVARNLVRLGIQRIQLVHDRTEFQRRAALSALWALQNAGVEVNCKPGETDGEQGRRQAWAPDLCYVLYSDEERALAMARGIWSQMPDIPILFGRSLLRESFIALLGEKIAQAWFVDLISRTGPMSTVQRDFMDGVSKTGVQIPTANHCFGWDAMTLGCRALREGKGDPKSAIDYLESGIVLEGVTGNFSFHAGDHNGRFGVGPTILSRWREDHIEEIV